MSCEEVKQWLNIIMGLAYGKIIIIVIEKCHNITSPQAELIILLIVLCLPQSIVSCYLVHLTLTQQLFFKPRFKLLRLSDRYSLASVHKF